MCGKIENSREKTFGWNFAMKDKTKKTGKRLVSFCSNSCATAWAVEQCIATIEIRNYKR